MTIDEAIRRLEQRTYPKLYYPGLDVDDIKLGIEALKLVKELRGCMPGSAATLLPGETEDKGVT